MSTFNTKKYWENRLKLNYNLQGVGDISMTPNYNRWSYLVSRFQLNKLLKKYFNNSNGKILDIGSGTGFVINVLKKHTNNIVGVDISKTAVSNLSRMYPKYKFFEVDVGREHIPIEDSSIDLITAASVLYHVIDDSNLEYLLQNVKRILKNDGIFIFSDNFIHSDAYKIEHQNCRTLNNYENILIKNGFEIEKRVANFVIFNDPVDAKSRFFPIVWRLITTLTRKSKFIDFALWPALFPLELILVSIIKESPAQEFMICRVRKN